MAKLEGQSVLIVGASSGIGRAAVMLALREGAKVLAVGRNEQKLKRLSSEAGSAHLQTVVMDVLQEEKIRDFLQTIAPPNHVLITAGSFVGGDVATSDRDTMSRALGRLEGSLNVIRPLAAKMTAQSSLVLVGGISTDRPSKGAWPTAVATAATEQLARCLALELAPIRVNAVAPGWTDTPMWDDILGAQKFKVFAEVAAKIPSGRLATDYDVADAAIFLMTNGSVNGEILHIDGGHRLV